MANNHNITFSDDTLPNMKDLYERYYSERDKQISFFWEHTKSIWGILALCFTGYGTILKDFLDKLPKSSFIELNNYSLVLIGISILGFATSWILLWMTKGCKALYEVFEVAIWKMESSKNIFNYNNNYLLKNFWELKEPTNAKRTFLSDSFSQSKINMLVAYMLIVLWGLLSIVHTITLFFKYDHDLFGPAFVTLIIIFVILGTILNKIRKKDIRSSVFKPKEKTNIVSEKSYNNIKKTISKEIVSYMNSSTISDEQKVNDISKLIYEKLTTEILGDLPKDRLNEIMAKL